MMPKAKLALTVYVSKNTHAMLKQIADNINDRKLKNEDGFPVKVNIGDVCNLAVVEYAKKFNNGKEK